MRAVTPSRASQVRLSRSGFYRATRAGEYERIARGIYVPSAGPTADWDMLEAAARRPHSTICLTSALALHDLVVTIPDSLDVALPRPSRKPATTGAIVWHMFDKETFSLAREEVSIEGTQERIGLYSAERSIVDAFRLRSVVGYETALEALKTWLARGGKPSRLLTLAQELPRSRGPLSNALDVLT